MEIKIRRSSTIYIIDVSGDMDMYNAYKVKNLVNKMIEKNIQNFIINMEGVNYIDSSGIGALIYVHSELKKRNMKFRIANIRGTVKKVIELTKLMGYFKITDTVENAIKQIKAEL